jgi:hypothetical protein
MRSLLALAPLAAGHYRAPRGVTAYTRKGTALVAGGVIATAGTGEHCRPLAVMPPGPGKRTAYLIVGTYKTPELLVLSLPDFRPIHTHILEGMQVRVVKLRRGMQVRVVKLGQGMQVRVVKLGRAAQARAVSEHKAARQ